MTRTSKKESSLVSFLDLIFEASKDSGEKKKKKAPDKPIGTAEQPLDIPSDELTFVEPFNKPRFIQTNKADADARLRAVGYGQPHYTPPPKKEEESPSDVLNKLKASKESGEMKPEEYEVLKNKVVATTFPKVSRKGLATSYGATGTVRQISKPKVSVDVEHDPYDVDDIEMDDYRGAKEMIPKPSKGRTFSKEQRRDVAAYNLIASGSNAEKIKFGDKKFMHSDEEGYEKWQPKVPGNEWTEEDLPTKGYVGTINTAQAAKEESDYALEKEALSNMVPKFVLHGMVKAARDYKELLRPKLEVIKKAAQAYAKYLKAIDKLRSVSVANSDMTDEELSMLDTNDGLASLVSLSARDQRGKYDSFADFMTFFKLWITNEEGVPFTKAKASEVDKKKLGVGEKSIMADTPTGPVPSSMLLRSALEIVQRLGIIDLDDDTPATGNIAAMLELETAYKPELSRVEQFLIARQRPDKMDPTGKKIIRKGDMSKGDPGYRYFFGDVQAGEGGRRYYWDWIRRQAKKAGKYPEDEPWALKSKMISDEEKDK